MHEAVPRARAEPLLTGVARGTRRGETVQVQAPAAVLDLDAAVRRGDENPFFQRRRVVGLRAVYALGELKARVEANAPLHDPVLSHGGPVHGRRAVGKGETGGYARG